MKPPSPYSPGASTVPVEEVIDTLAPSREYSGFFTKSVLKRPGSKLAARRLGCPGNISHSTGRIPLLDTSIFHAGPITFTLPRLRLPPTSPPPLHPHPQTLKSPSPAA